MATGKNRLQFELTDDQMEKLNELMRACNLTTRKDLLNNALTLLE